MRKSKESLDNDKSECGSRELIEIDRPA